VNTKKMIMTVMFLTAIYIVFAEQAIGNDTGDRRIISGERCTKYVAVSVSQSRRETLEDILNIMKHVRDIKKLEDIIKEKIENNIQTKKCLEKSNRYSELVNCRNVRINKDDTIKESYGVGTK